MTCPSCQRDTEDDWRYCAACGEPTAITRGAGAQEHHVTMVVSDLQGSTALAEGLDPESLRAVLDRYFDELGAVLEAHGGRIEKRIGDAMVTVFGLPIRRDDDAERALRAVAECQGTLASLNQQFERTWGVRLVNRTGVATGPVVLVDAGAGHRVLAGHAFDLAMQLEPVAPPLEALVGSVALAEAGDAVEAEPITDVTLKSGAVVKAARLISVAEGEDVGERVASDPARCATCASEIDVTASPRWRWCPSCASPLVATGQHRQSRRTLTAVFGDLRPFDPDAHSADAIRLATVAAFEGLRAVLERHGATVEKYIGDAVMAVFGLDRRREDDAVRAVRAAVEMQQYLAAHQGEVELDLRIGVNTGPVIAGDPRLGQRLVTGDAVNVAARLEQTAESGQVVIGGLTRRLVGNAATLTELAPLTLKGKSEPVPAYRVEHVSASGASFARLELPLVGRDAELDLLVYAFESAVSTRRFRWIDIVGDVGMGKSRLMHELLNRVGPRAVTLHGACLSYGEGITFWPIVEIVQSAIGAGAGEDGSRTLDQLTSLVGDQRVVDRLGSLLGVGDEIYPVGELFFAVRRLFEAMAARHPLVVVIDGLHWAEQTLLDLLTSIEENVDAQPILLITLSRPSDGVDIPVSSRLELSPLADADASRLISAVVGEGALPPMLADRVRQAAAGNPLFVEQFLTMLVDDGLIVSSGDSWRVVGDLSTVSVPPTVEAVLAARVDALEDDERRTIEPASVIGREFPEMAVAALDDADIETGVTLGALERRQFVSKTNDVDPLVDYRFKSLLLRDVIYGSLLKRNRSELHERFADWLEALPELANRQTELEEILGYHLEQAFLLRAQLEALDEGGVALGRRAAARLERAGRRAFRRGDMPAAANLLTRAARTLPIDDPALPALLSRAGSARMETGLFKDANALFDEAEMRARELDDDVGAAAADLARTTMRYLTGDGIGDAQARSTAARTLEVFREAGDESGQARSFCLVTQIEAMHCQWGATERAATQMIEHARRADDVVLLRRFLPAVAGFLLHGPTPVHEAIARCQEILDATADDHRGRAITQRLMGCLLAMDDRIDEARRLCEEARNDLEELGWNFDASLVSLELGPAELMAGDPASAEAAIRRDYEALDAMGEQNYISTVGAWLAEAVRRQGRNEEATELIDRAAEIAAEDDVISQALIHGVRAKVAASSGDLDSARRLGEDAVTLLRQTDELAAIGEALLDLAEILVLNGESDAAVETAREGRGVLVAKGVKPLIRRADALLSRLSSAN